MAENHTISVNEAKKRAAEKAVVDWLNGDTKIVGVGSGSTIVPAVTQIAKLHKEGKLNGDIVFIPTSFQARELIISNDLPMGSLETHPQIEVAIDGADEIDPSLNCIKGGGGCHFQEKLVAYNASTLILIADWRKESPKLGTCWTKGVPISVYPPALQPVKNRIQKLGGEVTLRAAQSKAGPVVTDDGALILDTAFENMTPERIQELDQQLHMIPGVVETGFFTNAACAYIGLQDGSVKILKR